MEIRSKFVETINHENMKNIFLVLVLVIFYYVACGDDSESTSEENLEQSITLKKDQQNLTALIDSVKVMYENTENPLKKTALRKERKNALKTLFNNRNVSNWKGELSDMNTSTDNQGKAYISVRLLGTNSVNLGTSYISDMFPVGSKLFNKLSEIEVGDIIEFSGTFRYDYEYQDHLDENSSTEYGSMHYPEFNFIFKSIEKYVPETVTTDDQIDTSND